MTIREITVTFVLAAALTCSLQAAAQNAPDLVGLWTSERVDSEKGRCGVTSIITRLDVTKKITARAYRGSATTLRSSAECGVTPMEESSFTLRIRDNNISVEYDEVGWPSQDFVLEENRLTGKYDDGAPLEFARAVDSSDPVETLDLSALDELLAEMRPGLYDELGNEYGTRMLRNLRRTGLDSKQARQVAEETMWRMADCVIAMLREDLVGMAQSMDQLMNSQQAQMLLDPKELDYREYECINDTAMNAGVIIK